MKRQQSIRRVRWEESSVQYGWVDNRMVDQRWDGYFCWRLREDRMRCIPLNLSFRSEKFRHNTKWRSRQPVGDFTLIFFELSHLLPSPSPSPTPSLSTCSYSSPYSSASVPTTISLIISFISLSRRYRQRTHSSQLHATSPNQKANTTGNQTTSESTHFFFLLFSEQSETNQEQLLCGLL